MKKCTRKGCIHKGELQPLSNFNKKLTGLYGVYSYCKDCNKKRCKEHLDNRKKERDFYSQFSAI